MEKIIYKISKKAVDTYHAASKQAGKVAKEIKLKTKMAENKGKIQELYEDIGKTVYEKYVLKEEINIERDLFNNCAIIDNLANENENIRMKLLKLKDLKQCPKCNYEIYYDFKYCPNCGYVQNEQNGSETWEANDGPATILTTDSKDAKLKQHIDTFQNEEEIIEDI